MSQEIIAKPPAQNFETMPEVHASNIVATPDANSYTTHSDIEVAQDPSLKAWLSKHKIGVALGFVAVGAVATVAPHMAETAEAITENAHWAVPALVTTELAWNSGAMMMLASAGRRIGNPFTLHSRVGDLLSSVSKSKLFRTGLGVNIAGEIGTAGILTAGSIAELPPSSWPLTIGGAAVLMAPGVGLWTGIYKSDKDRKNKEDTASIAAVAQADSYWIGKVSEKDQVYDEGYFDNLSKFRANVYVDELKFLTKDALDDEGREIDLDDRRSVNFAVIDKTKERIVGSGRLIHKETETPVLPIEHYFPELFENTPISIGSVEISRFIARHDDEMTQHKIALSIIRAMTFYSLENKVEEAYCIIEKPLLEMLKFIGIPLELLAEKPKDIVEYGGVLYPVRIRVNEVLGSVKNDKSGRLGLDTFFSSEAYRGGLGYYPDSFVTEGINHSEAI